MKLIYTITKYLTFPGTFSKGFFEHLSCRLLGVNIYAADKYVTRTALSGHVALLPPDSCVKSFLMCFLPGLFNLILGLPGWLCSVVAIEVLGIRPYDIFSGKINLMFFVYCFLLWFCSSLLCNLFPYAEDARHMWKQFSRDGKASLITKIILFIPSVIIVIGAYLEKYGITLLACIAFAIYLLRDLIF